MGLIKTYSEWMHVNERVDFADPSYVRPYYKSKNVAKELINGEQLNELLTTPGFKFAYGKNGGYIAYLMADKLNKKSYDFLIAEDGVTVNVVKTSKSGDTILGSFKLDDPVLDPAVRRAAEKGLTGTTLKSGKVNPNTPTDFSLMKLVHMNFQFHDKSIAYPEMIEKSRAYATEYASKPGNIENYINNYPEEWAKHVQTFLKSHADVDPATLEGIVDADTFVNVILAKNPYNATPSKPATSIYAKKGDEFSVNYMDATYYLLATNDLGEPVINEVSQDVYNQLSKYFGGSASKSYDEKQIASELDSELHKIGTSYEIKQFILDHIVCMNFSYRIPDEFTGVKSLRFVNEDIQFEDGDIFDAATIKKLIETAVEPMRFKARDLVTADKSAETVIDAEDGDENIEF